MKFDDVLNRAGSVWQQLITDRSKMFLRTERGNKQSLILKAFNGFLHRCDRDGTSLKGADPTSSDPRSTSHWTPHNKPRPPTRPHRGIVDCAI